jgi:phage terminase large subunit-like protein
VLAWIPEAVGPLPASKLYLTKQRPEQKIDAAVALMMAVGRAMAADDGQPDILEFLRNPIF